MSPDIALTLTVVALALVLFWWERYPADVVGLAILLALVFAGLLPVDQAFVGFGSDSVIMILALLILTAAMERTGVVDMTARFVLRHAGDEPTRLLWVIMITSAVLSAFISNTAAAAFFLPVVLGVARKTGAAASQLLMPLAFSVILASSLTLISTSTNVVVSGIMTRYEMPPLTMFELTPVGLPIALVGVLYMIYIGRRLIPAREGSSDKMEAFGVRPYLSEVLIQDNSWLADKTLAEVSFGQSTGLTVLQILRGRTRMLPGPETRLKAGDVLLVEGTQKDIITVKDTAGIEIRGDSPLSDATLSGNESMLVEASVGIGSPLIGNTLMRYQFRTRHGLQVIGLNRRGVNVNRRIANVRIRLGDVLLLQGPPDLVVRLQSDPGFHVLGAVGTMSELRPRRRHAWVAVGIFGMVVLLGTFEVLPLAIALLLGVLLVFVTGCITPEEAYASVYWKVLILVACLLGLGVAMESTGTADYLAGLIAGLMGGAHPLWVLGAFFILTVVLTQPMSNQAAAVVVLPVAIQTAQQLDLNPRTFAVMIAVAASCSFLTPLEPACLMVYGPGRYRFGDFLRVGSLLTLLILLIAMLLVPVIWPLNEHDRPPDASPSPLNVSPP